MALITSGDSGAETGYHLPVSVGQKLREIPANLAARRWICLLVGQELVQRGLVRSLYRHLGEHGKRDVVLGGAECLNLLIGPWFLPQEIGWRSCMVEMHDSSSIVSQHREDVQDLKPDRRHGEKVD